MVTTIVPVGPAFVYPSRFEELGELITESTAEPEEMGIFGVESGRQAESVKLLTKQTKRQRGLLVRLGEDRR